MAKKHTASPAPTPAAPEPSASDDGPIYPGGQDSPAYRWAFNAFVLLFLLQVCLGLLNYLGWYLKTRWGA